MEQFSIELACTAPDTDLLTEDFPDIADAFYDLAGIDDQEVDLDTTERILVFRALLTAEDEASAMEAAISAVRTALHIAGQGTSGWEKHYRMVRQAVERQSEQHPVDV